MAWVILVWLLVVGVVGLNLCAAGIVAILYAWRRSMRNGARIVTAVLASGLLPASTIIFVVGMTESGLSNFVGATSLLLAFVMVTLIGGAASLPAATVVSRKLEAPGDDFRTFE